MLFRGIATANVYHKDGQEYLSNTRGTGTARLDENGRYSNSIPLQLLIEPTRYFCDGDTLRLHGERLGALELTRV